MVLTPKLSLVLKLAREIEKKRQRAGVSVAELIENVQRDRATVQAIRTALARAAEV